jgi:hypothetical protein
VHTYVDEYYMYTHMYMLLYKLYILYMHMRIHNECYDYITFTCHCFKTSVIWYMDCNQTVIKCGKKTYIYLARFVRILTTYVSNVTQHIIRDPPSGACFKHFMQGIQETESFEGVR